MGQVKKLFNKNYVLLFQGQTVSRIGSQIYFMAMALFVKDLTGSGALMGLLVMIASFPSILLAPIGGTYADRFSRKKIIVSTDLLNGLSMLLLTVLLIYFPARKVILLPGLMVITIFSNILAAFFTPAISASLPEIVPKSKLHVANSLGQSSVQISTILGWASSGTLYLLLGAPMLVFLNGITFIFSGMSELFISIPQQLPDKVKSWKEQFRVFKNDTLEGMRYVWKRPGLKKLVFASVFMTFFTSPILFLLMFYVEVVLIRPESWFGYLIATNALGSMVGALTASMLKLSPKKRSRMIILFMILNSLIFLMLGFITRVAGAFFLLFSSGILTGFVQVYITTIMQLSTESQIRGRVFGFLGTVSGLLGPIGVGLGGIVLDITNKNVPFIYGFCGLSLVLISLLVMMSSDIREFLAYGKHEAEEVEADEVMAES